MSERMSAVEFTYSLSNLYRRVVAPEVAFHATERRREMRLEVDEPAWFAIQGTSDWVYGRIKDLSVNGLSLENPIRPAQGDEVLIHWHGGYLAGRVRNVRQGVSDWRVGIALEKVQTQFGLARNPKRSWLQLL